MISNEELVKLYNEGSTSKKSKEIIFKQILKNFEGMTMGICHFYSNNVPLSSREMFFENAVQEANICLLKSIEHFDISTKNKFSTFYFKCLGNHIGNVFKNKVQHYSNEIIDNTIFDWHNGSDNNTIECQTDNKLLYNILKTNLDKINYTKPIHRTIFLDYIGFGEDGDNDENFASLGRKYQLSRMAIKKICNKYFNILKDILKANQEIENLKMFL